MSAPPPKVPHGPSPPPASKSNSAQDGPPPKRPRSPPSPSASNDDTKRDGPPKRPRGPPHSYKDNPSVQGGHKSPPPSFPRSPGKDGEGSESDFYEDVEEDSSDGEYIDLRGAPAGLPYGLKSMVIYVQYAVSIFRAKAGRLAMDPTAGTHEGSRIPIDLRAEVEMLTDAVLRAWNNRVRLDFSIAEVANLLESGGSQPRDKLLLERFTPPHQRNPDGSLRLIDVPTVYIDKEDRVVGWYIPNAFALRRSAQVSSVVQKYGERVLSIGGENWRDAEQNFANPEKCLMAPGTANFSVSWYNRGFNHLNSKPGPSATLKQQAGKDMLHRLRTVNCLMGCLLALVHPQAYEQGVSVFLELLQDPKKTSDPKATMEIFQDWATPFSGFAMVSNRESKPHRDTKGGKFCLDLLSTFGSYTNGRLDVSLLGGQYVYNPGTAFILPGYLFQHSASRTEGERLCLASFFRPNVGRGALGSDYEEHYPPTFNYLQSTYYSQVPKVDDKDIWN